MFTPPRSNQWNVGLRQAVRTMVVGAAYRGVRGYNLTSWYCAKAHTLHGYCEGTQQLGSRYKVLLSTDEGRSKYDAFDLTVDKPYSEEARWGFTLAYTHADAARKGWDFFTFDFPDVDPADWPFVNSPVERHHVTASGIVRLPFDLRLSSVVQLGSGIPFSMRDERAGWGPARVVVDWFDQDPPNFRQVDLRLEKSIRMPGRARVGVLAEVINAFDHDNFRGYEELAFYDNLQANANFAKPQTWTADSGRRLQLGLNFDF